MDVPTLTYGRDNNFLEFKSLFALRAITEYKDLGRLVELNAYYVPDAIYIDEEMLGEEQDPHGFHREVIKTEVINRTKVIADMKNNRGALYSMLKGQLSSEGIDALKLRDGFDQMDALKDPLALWREIVITHSSGETHSGPLFSKKSTRDAYQTIKQISYESLVVFRERFEFVLEAYVAAGNPAMADADVAMDFLEALDSNRYDTFKAFVINNAAMGIQQPPATWQLMYLAITKHVCEPERRNRGGNTIYATATDRRSNGKVAGHAEGRRTPAGRGRQPHRSRSPTKKQTAKSEDEQSDDETDDKRCWGCGGKGHILANCHHEQEPRTKQGASLYMVSKTSGPDKDEGAGATELWSDWDGTRSRGCVGVCQSNGDVIEF